MRPSCAVKNAVPLKAKMSISVMITKKAKQSIAMRHTTLSITTKSMAEITAKHKNKIIIYMSSHCICVAIIILYTFMPLFHGTLDAILSIC